MVLPDEEAGRRAARRAGSLMGRPSLDPLALASAPRSTQRAILSIEAEGPVEVRTGRTGPDRRGDLLRPEW